MLVRATAHAELTMRANLGKSCTHGCGLPCMYSIALPRSGGWLDATIRGLEQLGLAVTTRSAPLTLRLDRPRSPPQPSYRSYRRQRRGGRAVASKMMTAISCQRACHLYLSCATRRTRRCDRVASTTYPCAEARCMDPAAIGCIHCGKHGSKGAKRVVERVSQIALQRSDANDPPRRIVHERHLAHCSSRSRTGRPFLE